MSSSVKRTSKTLNLPRAILTCTCICGLRTIDNDDNKYNKNKFALISSHFIKTRKSLMIRCFQNSNQWRCNVIQILINKWIRCFQITVEPVYNGHPRDLSNWPLNTGSLKILTGRGLMSILMAYHTKTLHARKQ